MPFRNNTPGVGDECSCCRDINQKHPEHGIYHLMLVKGALVCPYCDVTPSWPNVKDGDYL